MRERTSRFIGAWAAVVLFVSLGVGQRSEAKYDELPNFHRVNEQLYRGAQPKTGGIETLARMGIKTIVNLRNDDENAQAEEVAARAASLRYFNEPLERLGRPADEQIERILSIINAPENQPVFVHCAHGADRTGVVVACYRIARDGWTGEAAKDEAKHYGLKFWQRSMKDYIHDYYEQKLKGKS